MMKGILANLLSYPPPDEGRAYATTGYGNDNTSRITIDEALATINRIEREMPVIVTTHSVARKMQERYPDRTERFTHVGRTSFTRLEGTPVEIYERLSDVGKRCLQLMEQGRKVIVLLE